MNRVRWLVAVVALAGAAPAAAADDPYFDFRGAFPVPGGTLRLEARCQTGAEEVSCRAESRGPSGQGFQAEGRLRLQSRPQAAQEPPEPAHPETRWF